MMSSEDRDILYPLVVNQLLHDGYGVFAISLKKLVNSNSDAVASDKLLKIVKLGLAVSKYLEDSNLSRDFPHIAHAFQPNLHNGASIFPNSSSSNNQSIDQSPQQILHHNGSQSAQFSLGLDQAIKLEPGNHSFNSIHFPLSAYQRQWSQITNRVNINLDGEIHELPGDGGPNKLFECSLCGKIFNRRDKVKRHLSELHHGIKRHQCVTCSRLFSRNDKLVRHIMTVHQGIKDFSCLHCPRKFSRRWEYQRHMQTTHPTLFNRLPQFNTSQAQSLTTQPHQPATAQQVAPSVSGASANSAASNNNSTSPVSSASTAGAAAAPSVSSPPASTPTASSTSTSVVTPTTSAAVTTTNRGIFPIFPNLTGQSVSPWASNIPSSSNSAGAPVFIKSESINASTVTTSAEASSSSTTAPPAASSNAHGIFPMFPVFSQPSTSASTSGQQQAITPFANNAVFPSPVPAFTPVSAPYHGGYAPMASTPVSNPSSQPACSESTSLTRMLL